MKDERKTKKDLVAELRELRGRVSELEGTTAAQALEAKPVAELIDLMRFTQEVSSKIHGLREREDVIRVVTDAFRA